MQRDVTWHAAIDSTSIDSDDSFHRVKVFHPIDFLTSSSPFLFLVFILLYVNVKLIKFCTHFIAIISENRITIRSYDRIIGSFSSFFFLFFHFPVSTCRSMHRLRDYLEISLQTTIMANYGTIREGQYTS